MIKKLKKARRCGVLAVIVISLLQIGCATGQTKKVALGMLGGGLVGAAVGHEYVHHGEHKEYESRNTIISAIVGALLVGGALAWHYEEMEAQTVEISGRYARYRLCNPNEMQPELAQKLGIGGDAPAETLKSSQVEKLAIALDDNTKWSFPIFRKRFLPPERGDGQVVSSRYIWEILKPGSFVTRSQDPQYFLNPSKEK